MTWNDLSIKEKADLMKVYIKNGISNLKIIQKHYNQFAEGGPLKSDYDNPKQYYDYNTAEEIPDMYDPKTKHWSSRDPRTGMILKNPKHPTFKLALEEDRKLGYTPYYDLS